jgi:flagellar protein FliO/FliZ
MLSWSAAGLAQPAEPAPDASLLGLVLPLLVVMFALAALWWVMRRQGGRGSASGPARIVQVMAVGPRERILIVDHDTQRIMLGVTPTAISLLAHLEPKDAVKNPANASASLNEHAAQTSY